MEEITNLNSENSWSDKQEELLIKWYKESIGYYWKHNKSSLKYHFRDRIIGIPSTISNAITGTALFISLRENNNDITIQIIIACIIILTTVFIAIQNFLGLSQLAEKHINASNRYRVFATSIETELSLSRKDRLNGIFFVKQTQKRFNELLEICPNITDDIEKKYKKILNSKEITNLYQIFINNEDNDINIDIENDLQNKIKEEIKVNDIKSKFERTVNYF